MPYHTISWDEIDTPYCTTMPIPSKLSVPHYDHTSTTWLVNDKSFPPYLLCLLRHHATTTTITTITIITIIPVHLKEIVREARSVILAGGTMQVRSG